MPADHPTCPTAILWDFDGTLGDTEPLWWRAEARFMGELGVTETDEEARSRVGMSMDDSLDQMLARADRRDLDHAWCADVLVGYVLEYLRTEGVTFRPGAVELLAQARAAGIRCALVSQSYADVLTQATQSLPAGSFDVIIGGDQVTRVKPDPEPYLLAAEQLGCAPASCVVIEDSPSGLASAEAAGIPALAVPFEAALTPGHRQRMIPTLSGFDLSDLCRAWAELADA